MPPAGRTPLDTVLFGGLPALAVALLLVGTHGELGITTDSVIYVAAARSLLAGDGLTLPGGGPLVHFPPLYPVLLALIGRPRADLLTAAAGLNTALFGANVLLIGVLLTRALRSRRLALFGTFAALTSLPLLRVHSLAWTEPTFLFSGFLGLGLLAEHLRRPRPIFLGLAAAAVGLAFLTRYAGISMVAVGTLGILTWSRKPARARVADAVVFTLASALPMAVWMVRNLRNAGALTDRTWAFHPLTAGHLRDGAGIVTSWFLPGWALLPVGLRMAVKGGLLVALLAGFAALFVTLVRRRAGAPPLVALSALFLAVYFGFLAFSISLLDAFTPLDNRILSPAFVAALIVTLYGVERYGPRLRFPAAGEVLISAALAFTVLSAYEAAVWVLRTHHGDRKGLAGDAWKRSPILGRVKELPSGVPIYSNAPEALYLLASRVAAAVPEKVNPGTGRVNASFAAQMERMGERLENEGGVVVFLSRAGSRPHLPTEEELRERLPLVPVAVEADGVIYGVAGRP